MPIRIASLTRRIGDNGQALHAAMASRLQGGADGPSEAEQALIEERRLLKEERERRLAQAREPKHAADKLVRTHHAQPKDKPKAKKETKEAKDAKAGKAHRSRAEKHAAKAAAIDAARRSPKKPAAKS
ncbi:hypothetical protein HLB44_10110 [Aquincola sp. S2]|uniref:Uncharacterized protein n=1 Tax=Pseudaquabacterium terrae TaxID=2732868 RepID=A0ABX2EFB8_9BURK|nr:hypothetical protein [Aquabacterium terrae]NRF67337.1 hypothetical protein [Aquabacterium terrae]